MPILAVVLAFSFLATVGFAAEFTGPVVSVLDGDTIEVLHNKRAELIGLNDSPRT